MSAIGTDRKTASSFDQIDLLKRKYAGNIIRRGERDLIH